MSGRTLFSIGLICLDSEVRYDAYASATPPCMLLNS